ncbi:MAG TPA: TlpA disulfide reductase family protein [Cyclobacteriaceae bacterium]
MYKPITIIVILFAVSLSAAGQANTAKVVKLADLQKVMTDPGSQVKVINFWATWCAPCIKELPLFEKISQQRKDVAVTLVSMDMDMDPNPEKVHKFVAKRKITASVLILDESNPNSYIDKIEKEWSGALPATIVINTSTGKRLFVERELHEGELEKLIEEVR